MMRTGPRQPRPESLNSAARGFVRTSGGQRLRRRGAAGRGADRDQDRHDGLHALGEVTIRVGRLRVARLPRAPAEQDQPPVVLVVERDLRRARAHSPTWRGASPRLGYLAIAPELFVRQGDASAYGEIAKLIARSRLQGARCAGDGRPRRRASAGPRRNGGDTGRLGVTGLLLGRTHRPGCTRAQPGVKAGVAWYGRLVGASNALTTASPVDRRRGRLNAPVLGLYGGADAGIPHDTVEKMKAALGRRQRRRREDASSSSTPGAARLPAPTTGRATASEAAGDGWKLPRLVRPRRRLRHGVVPASRARCAHDCSPTSCWPPWPAACCRSSPRRA